jgi:ABC-type ATPase involved in cell division
VTDLLKFEDIGRDLRQHQPLPGAHSVTLRPGQYKACAAEFAFGESLLLRALLGEPQLSAFEGHIFGIPLKGISRSRRRQLLRQIGTIPLKLITPPQCVYEFVALPLQITGLRTSQIDRKVRGMLAELELTVYARHQLNQLEPAKLRLVFLAQALIKAPKLVLFEVPGDESERDLIVPVLQRYAEHGGAVLALYDRNSAGLSEGISTPAEELVYAAS